MRQLICAALGAALMAGCGSGKEKIADRVEDNADRRAAAMEEASESMTNALQQNAVEQQAKIVRSAGEDRAEAIRDSDLEADMLTKQQKNALVEGKKVAGTQQDAPR